MRTKRKNQPKTITATFLQVNNEFYPTYVKQNPKAALTLVKNARKQGKFLQIGDDLINPDLITRIGTDRVTAPKKVNQMGMV